MKVITGIKRTPMYGDMILDDEYIYCERIGSKLKVKLFGLFWITIKVVYWKL